MPAESTQDVSAGLPDAYREWRASRLGRITDALLAVTVLCVVDDTPRAVEEMARVLRPCGRLVIGELGRGSLWAAKRRVRGWLGSRTWRAARFRTARELTRLVTDAGLEATGVRGAVYYPPFAGAAALLARCDAWPAAGACWEPSGSPIPTALSCAARKGGS